MAASLPTFTLDLCGDMKSSWEYFNETFNSYATLMGYRNRDAAEPPKELAALTYSLPKDVRIVQKNKYSGQQVRTNLIQP
jgi:hypothetical protein